MKQAPTMIHADEHYLWANHFLTCSSAQIFDYRGNVIGVLDITGKAGPKKDKDFGSCRCPVCGKSQQYAMVEKIIQHAQQNCSAQSNVQPIPFRTDANSIKLSADNHSTTPTGDRA